MRRARLVGLSADGRSLIVATETGEELAVAADDRLRAALRGDRPRLGQLEIEMDSALTPRDIQSRIRAGQSLEEVARVAGLPADRVERFAAPVLAEREHVARTAMAASVRRRGETSAHRPLQATLSERLRSRSVDLDTLTWDAHRLADGRWAVVAAYQSGEATRRAEFLFDVAGRFSVAGNDDARWAIGEQSPAKGPQPGRRRPEGQSGEPDGTEPTLDLSDELALVRVVQDPPPPAEAAAGEDTGPLATVQPLRRPAPAGEPQPEPAPEVDVAADELGEELGEESEAPEFPRADPLDELPTGDGHPENESREHRGLSDAVAVPDTVSGGWEPAIVVGYPVEPGPPDETEGAPAAHQPPPPPASGPDQTPKVVPRPAGAGTDTPGPPEQIVSADDRRAEAAAFAEEHDDVPSEPPAGPAGPVPDAALEPESPAEPEVPVRSGKRKRASVPTWDEIMFGGPKRG